MRAVNTVETGVGVALVGPHFGAGDSPSLSPGLRDNTGERAIVRGLDGEPMRRRVEDARGTRTSGEGQQPTTGYEAATG